MDIIIISCPFAKHYQIELKLNSLGVNIDVLNFPDLLRKEISEGNPLALLINERVHDGYLADNSQINRLIIDEILRLKSKKTILIGYPKKKDQLILFSEDLVKNEINYNLLYISIKEFIRDLSREEEVLEIKKEFERKGQFLELRKLDELDLPALRRVIK